MNLTWTPVFETKIYPFGQTWKQRVRLQSRFEAFRAIWVPTKGFPVRIRTDSISVPVPLTVILVLETFPLFSQIGIRARSESLDAAAPLRPLSLSLRHCFNNLFWAHFRHCRLGLFLLLEGDFLLLTEFQKLYQTAVISLSHFMFFAIFPSPWSLWKSVSISWDSSHRIAVCNEDGTQSSQHFFVEPVWISDAICIDLATHCCLWKRFFYWKLEWIVCDSEAMKKLSVRLGDGRS
jgi:hypothetical protein